jgi:hypothetical protein
VNRRDLIKALAAGGVFVAGELWVPGAAKIFLPPTKIFQMSETITVFEGDTLTVDAAIGHERFFVEVVRPGHERMEMWHGDVFEFNDIGYEYQQIVVDHFERLL